MTQEGRGDAELIKAYPWAVRVDKFDDGGNYPMFAFAMWYPPRSQWQDGPWMTEPDLVEWRTNEVPYPLMIVRGSLGSLCGYVGVPPGHPFHRRDVRTSNITWSAPCGGLMAPTGEPPACWWLGFDCAHWHQYSPARVAGMRLIKTQSGIEQPPPKGPLHYVDLDECRMMTEELARQLLEIAREVRLVPCLSG